MGIRNLSFMLMLVCAGLLTGCASAGKQFDQSRVGGLENGKTSAVDIKTMFGEPVSVKTESNSEIRVVHQVFLYGYGTLGSTTFRQLTVELKNDLLNAYHYLSSFDEDKTQANVSALTALKIKESTKDDAIKALGAPCGKAMIPTLLSDFRDKAKPGTVEIWSWVSTDKVSTFGRGAVETVGIFISFDAAGKITDIAQATATQNR